MRFSCKISHSILSHLERKGVDLGALFDSEDWPMEFIRDPGYWLEAPRMEQLLEFLLRHYGHLAEGDGLLTEAGHDSKALRAWGVLDSVLRMVGTTPELYAQPERMLSYFISPPPPLAAVVREAQALRFQWPLDASEYPCVGQYLQAALESLPSYIQKPFANVRWVQNAVTIQWSDQQESLLAPEAEKEQVLHPDLWQNILRDFEQSQKRLEESQLLLQERERELAHLREHGAARDMGQVEQQVLRLRDYFARAQQLVTLLVANGRNSPQVSEAMRRVDWQRVQLAAPQIIDEVVQSLRAESPAVAPKLQSGEGTLISTAVH